MKLRLHVIISSTDRRSVACCLVMHGLCITSNRPTSAFLIGHRLRVIIRLINLMQCSWLTRNGSSMHNIYTRSHTYKLHGNGSHLSVDPLGLDCSKGLTVVANPAVPWIFPTNMRLQELTVAVCMEVLPRNPVKLSQYWLRLAETRLAWPFVGLWCLWRYDPTCWKRSTGSGPSPIPSGDWISTCLGFAVWC